MEVTETRFVMVEDAELILVAYGSSARISMSAVEMARAQGIRAGLVRPITLWPFPTLTIRKLAEKNKKSRLSSVFYIQQMFFGLGRRNQFASWRIQKI